MTFCDHGAEEIRIGRTREHFTKIDIDKATDSRTNDQIVGDINAFFNKDKLGCDKSQPLRQNKQYA